MKIHPKGISVIVLFMMLVILVISLLTAFTTFESTYNVLIWSAGGILVLLFSMFFRYPVRKPFHNTNAILSAADGKVVAIEKVYEKEYFLKEMQVISVFMSIYDVHVNFLPIDGKIVYTKHHPGKNYPAINPKSSELNEMYSTVIKNESTAILVRQIAGIAARRIYLNVKEDDNVVQGEELGLIKLGSRVDIFLPAEVKVNVKLHDKVVAGQSVLAWIS